jgi:hypothetical protein
MMKKMSAVLFGLMLVPTLALAAIMEGTVLKMGKTEIVVQTDKGEKQTLQVASNTKGLENAKEGARVKIEYSQKGDKLVATAISSSEASQPTAPSGRTSAPPLK